MTIDNFKIENNAITFRATGRMIAYERHAPGVTQKTLTDEMIREVRDRVMGGSPLSEDTLVALGYLILDEGDPDVNISDARDRICAWINRRNDLRLSLKSLKG